ncbi:histidine phosphatase family protein [Candidatus Saccharibacteria bacterium]|nr:histidine phosphatase family protein [Candidatus Saccharibacteria bacterium]
MNKTTALLTFMRHGEKDEPGNLTEEGLAQARARGKKTTSLHGDVLLFHSGVGRVKDTIRSMAANLHLSPDSEESYMAGSNIIDYVSPNLHYLRDMTQKGQYFGGWDKNIDLTDRNATDQRMRTFLSLDRGSPDANREGLSPREMAKNIAIMIGIEVRFANMTSQDTVVNFVNGSHEPVLMAFIHYFLHGFEPYGMDTVSEVGGSIEYAESFDIEVTHLSTDPRDFVTTFRFRDIERRVNLDVLRAFGYSE